MASNPTPSSRTSSRAASGTPWVRAGVTALAAGILGVGAIAFAQDTRPTDGDPPLMGPPQREAGPRAARGRGPGGPGGGMRAIMEKLELTDEQKQDARRQIHRFARGVDDGVLEPWSLQMHLQPVMRNDPQTGEMVMKEKVADEDLLTMVDNLRTAADEAGVADEDYEMDIIARINNAIDQALAEKVEP